jgi:hypothetical protein
LAEKELEEFISSPPTFSSFKGKGKSVKGERAKWGWDLLHIVSGSASHELIEWMVDNTNEGHKYKTKINLKKLKVGEGFIFFFFV